MALDHYFRAEASGNTDARTVLQRAFIDGELGFDPHTRYQLALALLNGDHGFRRHVDLWQYPEEATTVGPEIKSYIQSAVDKATLAGKTFCDWPEENIS